MRKTKLQLIGIAEHPGNGKINYAWEEAVNGYQLTNEEYVGVYKYK